MSEEVKEVKLKPLTKKQLQFVSFWEGNNTDAARKAGLKHPNVAGAKMMKFPAVKAAIEAKQKAMVQYSGEEVAKRAKVGRGDVIEWLANVARTSKNEFAVVSACGHLSEIFGMKVKQIRDVTDLFEGWNDEELEAYSRTGELPQRLKSGSKGESPASI